MHSDNFFYKRLYLTIFTLLISLALIQNGHAQICENLSNATGSFDCDINFDGANREYTLYVPNSIGSGDVALVVDMHGFSTNRFFQAFFSGWQGKADEEGFIVITPQGLNDSWNADICCGGNREDDVGAIKAIVEQVDRSYRIDRNKIFATGLSNGGGMSHKLACEAADVFSGIAAVSFPITRSPSNCNPSEAVTITHFHGLNDTIIRYGGGSVGSVSAPQSLEYWREILDCQAGPETTYTIGGAVCESYSRCAGDRDNTLCTINGGHLLYSNNDGLNIPDVAWAYLNREVDDDDDDNDDDNEPSINLSASTGSFFFWRWADLSWQSDAPASFDIYRNGTLIDSNVNETSYRNFVGGGNYEYQVCVSGSSSACSNTVMVSL